MMRHDRPVNAIKRFTDVEIAQIFYGLGGRVNMIMAGLIMVTEAVEMLHSQV